MPRKKLAKRSKANGKKNRPNLRRRIRLDDVITKAQLRQTFKTFVWKALRKQSCVDLFGYYDYNLAIDDHCEHLTRAVRGGSYQRQQPIQLELTKSDLLVRRLQLPHPDEALLMTAIANGIEPRIKALQPSKATYYGRSDTKQRGIHLINQNEMYSWHTLWPFYQKQLLEFAKKRRLLVTTDIQNFFDSINIGHLRTKLTETLGSDEIPNFIIYLFENFAVRDRYAPFRGLGIPTIDSDLPRLVAHCLFFEVDDYLKKNTSNSYSRWVDDFNFGVTDRSMARTLLRQVERILFRQGLRLGGSKTDIRDKSAVSEYIQEQENQYLNVVLRNKDDDNNTPASITGSELTDRLLAYHQPNFDGSMEKVVRRYYNAFAIRDWHGFTISPKSTRELYRLSKADFNEQLDSRFRQSVIWFWLSLPPTQARLNRLLKIVTDDSAHDDVLTATVLQGLAHIKLSTKLGRHAIMTLAAIAKNRPGIFYGYAWLLAKNGNRKQILDFASKSYPFWSAHELYARQIVALWALLPECPEKKQILGLLRGGEGRSVEQLLRFVEQMQTVSHLTSSLSGYLPPGLNSPRFDLYRAVISNLVCRSANLSKEARAKLKHGIRTATKDPLLRDIALGVHAYA